MGLNDATDAPTTTSGIDGQLLPVVPATQPPQHQAVLLREQLDDYLAKRNLLGVALGHGSSRARAIVDIDLDRLPPLDAAAPDYASRLTRQLEYERRNEENAYKRYNLELSDWTEVYAICAAATSKAVALKKQMRDLCDLHALGRCPDNYYDGPRAYQMVINHLLGSAGDRSREDKEYYEHALELQIKSPLPDGVLATDYHAKGYAAIVYILPNLARPISDVDAAEYIVDMMPSGLATERRLLKRKLKE